MSTINEIRLGLAGSTPEILTLGLLLVRRDLNLVGICPGALDFPQSSPASLQRCETIVQHSTLLLGCPVYNSAAELECDLIIADADTAANLQKASAPIVALHPGSGSEKFSAQADSAEALEQFQQLWERLNAAIPSDNDGGLLSWEQAHSLVETLLKA